MTHPIRPAADYLADADYPKGWTPERQRLFLASIAETGIVAHAAKAVDMGLTSAYGLRHRSYVFDLAWDAAH